MTVTNSTIAGNTNDGLNNDGSEAGGISLSYVHGTPATNSRPQATIANTTIADNTDLCRSGAGGIYVARRIPAR